jgi:hypothetical protein
MKRNHIIWVTRSAVFIALIISAQTLTAPMGQYVTGSIVNLILIVAAVICGWQTGAAVALFSPLLASFFGIMPPFIQLIPFLMLGNLALVLAVSFVNSFNITGNTYISHIVSVICGALAKFAVLYFGVVHFVIKFLIEFTPETRPTPEALSAIFSVNQLITAAIGGAISVAVVPLVKHGIRKVRD